MFRLIQVLFRYRALIASLVSRELKARYRGSFLGFLWSFANPILLLVIHFDSHRDGANLFIGEPLSHLDLGLA